MRRYCYSAGEENCALLPLEEGIVFLGAQYFTAISSPLIAPRSPLNKWGLLKTEERAPRKRLAENNFGRSRLFRIMVQSSTASIQSLALQRILRKFKPALEVCRCLNGVRGTFPQMGRDLSIPGMSRRRRTFLEAVQTQPDRRGVCFPITRERPSRNYNFKFQVMIYRRNIPCIGKRGKLLAIREQECWQKN